MAKRAPRCAHTPAYESQAALRAVDRRSHAQECHERRPDAQRPHWHAYRLGPADYPLTLDQMCEHAHEVFRVTITVNRTGPDMSHVRNGPDPFTAARTRISKGWIDPELGLIVHDDDSPEWIEVQWSQVRGGSPPQMRRVKAERFGNLAVHPDVRGATEWGKGFTVTHVPSGLCVNALAECTRKEARDIARMLQDVSDWGPEVTTYPDYKQIVARAKVIMRHVIYGEPLEPESRDEIETSSVRATALEGAYLGHED